MAEFLAGMFWATAAWAFGWGFSAAVRLRQFGTASLFAVLFGISLADAIKRLV